MPLCYLTEFAWASTETRKIVKGEERIVHFLDAKQTVRQTQWGHMYAEGCSVCTLRTICGGMFDRGDGYDPAELYPVFVARDRIVSQIIHDGGPKLRRPHPRGLARGVRGAAPRGHRGPPGRGLRRRRPGHR